MNELTLVPAYGRDYKSKAAVQADWDANKDFQIHGGPYINKADAEQKGISVRIRYQKLRKVMTPCADK